MKPKMHLFFYALIVWGGATLLFCVMGILLASITLPYYLQVTSLFAVLLILGYYYSRAKLLVRGGIPICCPDCRQPCTMQIKPKIYYRCSQCSFRWDSGIWASGLGPDSGG